MSPVPIPVTNFWSPSLNCSIHEQGLTRFIIVFWGLIALVDDLWCVRSSTAKQSRVCSNHVVSEGPSLCIGRCGDPFKK
jgi:hypothetical protein